MMWRKKFCRRSNQEKNKIKMRWEQEIYKVCEVGDIERTKGKMGAISFLCGVYMFTSVASNEDVIQQWCWRSTCKKVIKTRRMWLGTFQGLSFKEKWKKKSHLKVYLLRTAIFFNRKMEKIRYYALYKNFTTFFYYSRLHGSAFISIMGNGSDT